MKVDAVLVMGKELRLDRERGLRELRARAAAASVVARRSESVLMALEVILEVLVVVQCSEQMFGTDNAQKLRGLHAPSDGEPLKGH